MHDFTVYGMPYLQKYSNLENVLEDIRVDDDRWKGILLMPFHDLRAKYAIGVAYLLGQYESFNQIAAAKEAYLISMDTPGFQLGSFREFRNELELHFKR